MEAILEFLTSVPGPTGKPALEFVLLEWCSRQHLFFGAYERKVSSVALCKILQHAITHNDQRFQDIHVQGDEIAQQTNGIRTRSKALQEPTQWTSVPVLVKIYKLLINELSNQMETNASLQANNGLDDEDEGWDEDDEDGDEVQFTGQTLYSLLDQYDKGDYQGLGLDEEDEDDPDALQDPTSQIDLQAYLTEFFQSFSQQPCFSVFTSHHTDVEKQVLHAISINV
ncbi:hypothetical protein ScPMuIL_010165 [Solemya velum]